MIERSEHGDVNAYRLSWWRSRLIGYGVYVYTTRGVMIDTGFPAARREVDTIVAADQVRGVYVTHQHEDHAGNVPWLAQCGIPFAMNAATEHALHTRHRIGLYRHITWRATPVLRAPIVPFTEPGLALEHAPGHVDDHHVVWDSTTNTVFAGDLFLGVRVVVAHRYEQPLATLASLRAVIARTPDRVFCAHRGLLAGGTRQLQAKVDWIEGKIGEIHTWAERGLSVREIRMRVLGGPTSTHWASRGDYSPDNFVFAVLRDTAKNG